MNQFIPTYWLNVSLQDMEALCKNIYGLFIAFIFAIVDFNLKQNTVQVIIITPTHLPTQHGGISFML